MKAIPTERRALILDFDGVIVETEALHFRCWKEAFAELYGLHVDGDHRQIVGLSLDAIYTHWARSTATQSVLTNEAKERLLAYKTSRYFELGATLLEPMDGLVELVTWAQDVGWYVTIASRARRLRLLRTLDMLALRLNFDLIMGTEDLVDAYTDRKLHTLSAAPFGVAASDCVVIEDSASGVRDARACGVGIVIGLTTSLDAAALRTAGAMHVVDTLVAVKAILERSE